MNKTQKNIHVLSMCGGIGLTRSFIYRSTHFHTYIEEKKLQENIVVEVEIAYFEQFNLSPQFFLCNLYLKIVYSHILVVFSSLELCIWDSLKMVY